MQPSLQRRLQAGTLHSFDAPPLQLSWAREAKKAPVLGRARLQRSSLEWQDDSDRIAEQAGGGLHLPRLGQYSARGPPAPPIAAPPEFPEADGTDPEHQKLDKEVGEIAQLEGAAEKLRENLERARRRRETQLRTWGRMVQREAKGWAVERDTMRHELQAAEAEAGASERSVDEARDAGEARIKDIKAHGNRLEADLQRMTAAKAVAEATHGAQLRIAAGTKRSSLEIRNETRSRRLSEQVEELQEQLAKALAQSTVMELAKNCVAEAEGASVPQSLVTRRRTINNTRGRLAKLAAQRRSALRLRAEESAAATTARAEAVYALQQREMVEEEVARLEDRLEATRKQVLLQTPTLSRASTPAQLRSPGRSPTPGLSNKNSGMAGPAEGFIAQSMCDLLSTLSDVRRASQTGANLLSPVQESGGHVEICRSTTPGSDTELLNIAGNFIRQHLRTPDTISSCEIASPVSTLSGEQERSWEELAREFINTVASPGISGCSSASSARQVILNGGERRPDHDDGRSDAAVTVTSLGSEATLSFAGMAEDVLCHVVGQTDATSDDVLSSGGVLADVTQDFLQSVMDQRSSGSRPGMLQEIDEDQSLTIRDNDAASSTQYPDFAKEVLQHVFEMGSPTAGSVEMHSVDKSENSNISLGSSQAEHRLADRLALNALLNRQNSQNSNLSLGSSDAEYQLAERLIHGVLTRPPVAKSGVRPQDAAEEAPGVRAGAKEMASTEEEPSGTAVADAIDVQSHPYGTTMSHEDAHTLSDVTGTAEHNLAVSRCIETALESTVQTEVQSQVSEQSPISFAGKTLSGKASLAASGQITSPSASEPVPSLAAAGLLQSPSSSGQMLTSPSASEPVPSLATAGNSQLTSTAGQNLSSRSGASSASQLPVVPPTEHCISDILRQEQGLSTPTASLATLPSVTGDVSPNAEPIHGPRSQSASVATLPSSVGLAQPLGRQSRSQSNHFASNGLSPSGDMSTSTSFGTLPSVAEAATLRMLPGQAMSSPSASVVTDPSAQGSQQCVLQPGKELSSASASFVTLPSAVEFSGFPSLPAQAQTSSTSSILTVPSAGGSQVQLLGPSPGITQPSASQSASNLTTVTASSEGEQATTAAQEIMRRMLPQLEEGKSIEPAELLQAAQAVRSASHGTSRAAPPLEVDSASLQDTSRAVPPPEPDSRSGSDSTGRDTAPPKPHSSGSDSMGPDAAPSKAHSNGSESATRGEPPPKRDSSESHRLSGSAAPPKSDSSVHSLSRDVPPAKLDRVPPAQGVQPPQFVIHDGEQLPVYSKHDLDTCSTDDLREQASRLHWVLGHDRIGAVPVADEDLHQWIEGVQHAHLQPLLGPETVKLDGKPVLLLSDYNLKTRSPEALREHAQSLVEVLGQDRVGVVPADDADLHSWVHRVQKAHLEPLREQKLTIHGSEQVVATAGDNIPLLTDRHLNMLSAATLHQHATRLHQMLGHEEVGALPTTDEELRPWIINAQRRHSGPLQATEVVDSGGVLLPLIPESVLRDCHPSRLRAHANLLTETLGLQGSPAPEDDAQLCDWVRNTQNEKLQHLRVPQRVLYAQEDVPLLTQHHLNKYSRSQLLEHALGLQQVLGKSQTGDVPDSEQDLRTWISDLQEKYLAPLKNAEFVLVGDLELPILPEATLRACHPSRLRVHAMQLEQALGLLRPQEEADLWNWISDVQRLHLEPQRAPQITLDGERVQRTDFTRAHASQYVLYDGSILPVLSEPTLRVCPVNSLRAHAAELSQACGVTAPAKEAELIPWISKMQCTYLEPLCDTSDMPGVSRVEPGSRLTWGDSSDSNSGPSRLSMTSARGHGYPVSPASQLLSECAVCGLPILPPDLQGTGDAPQTKPSTAPTSPASASSTITRPRPSPAGHPGRSGSRGPYPDAGGRTSSASAASLLRIDEQYLTTDASDVVSFAGAPETSGHAQSDSGSSLMRMNAQSPPAAYSDLASSVGAPAGGPLSSDSGGSLMRMSAQSPPAAYSDLGGRTSSDGGASLMRMDAQSPPAAVSDLAGHASSDGGGSLMRMDAQSPPAAVSDIAGHASSVSGSGGSLMRMDAQSPPAAVSDLAGHASSDSGGSLMRMDAQSPPAAVSDLATSDAVERGEGVPLLGTKNASAAASAQGPLAGAPSPVAQSSNDSRAQTPASVPSTGTTPPPKKWCCCC